MPMIRVFIPGKQDHPSARLYINPTLSIKKKNALVVSYQDDENVLKLVYGDGCSTPLSQYKLLNCTLVLSELYNLLNTSVKKLVNKMLPNPQMKCQYLFIHGFKIPNVHTQQMKNKGTLTQCFWRISVLCSDSRLQSPSGITWKLYKENAHLPRHWCHLSDGWPGQGIFFKLLRLF